MSGHSHWATTQRAKGIKDVKRGKLFSKLARQISIATKEGGGPDPDSNYKLRIIVDTARAANMPKENIERAISKGSGEGAALTEVMYEGFGPGGVGLLIETTTDNRNRTAQEMKNILEKSGGGLGGPNSVSFNFISRGFLLIPKVEPLDEQILNLIDAGVEDYNEVPDGLELFVDPSSLYSVKETLAAKGYQASEYKLIKKPVTLVELSDKDSEKLAELVEKLEELDDVGEVFVNAA